MIQSVDATFSVIQAAVGKQFKAMSSNRLFAAAVDRDALWDLYLASFPAGSNPIYKTRTEHDSRRNGKSACWN